MQVDCAALSSSSTALRLSLLVFGFSFKDCPFCLLLLVAKEVCLNYVWLSTGCPAPVDVIHSQSYMWLSRMMTKPLLGWPDHSAVKVKPGITWHWKQKQFKGLCQLFAFSWRESILCHLFTRAESANLIFFFFFWNPLNAGVAFTLHY